MFGNNGRFLPPRSVAPRIRGAKLRRQTPVVEPVAAEPADSTESDTAPGEPDSPSDSESDDETTTLSPGQPTPTAAPALDGSKTTERVIPTLTAITHAPRPIPPMFAGGGAQKGDQLEEIRETRTTETRPSLPSPTDDKNYDTDDVQPGGVWAGIKPSETSANPSAVTGAKGLLESGETDAPVATSAPSRGGLNAGAKAGIAVGTIAGVALLAGLLFFLWRWKRARKGHRLDDDAPELPYSNANNQTGATGPSATIDPRSNSQILDDLIAASYAHQNGGTMPAGGVWSAQDEKRDLEHANVANIAPQSRQLEDDQPQIRFSIASWLRRHHPLKLNPMGSKRGSMASSAVSSAFSRSGSGASKNSVSSPPTVRDSSSSSILNVKTMMKSRWHDSVRPDQSVSQRNTMATEVTNSVYDYYARPESKAAQDVVPPLPAVYNTAGQTKTQALANKYQSVWSDSTATTTSGASGATGTSGITASSGAIPIALIPGKMDSMVTDQSGGTSVLFMYDGDTTNGNGKPRPETGLTGLSTGSSVYPAQQQGDPLPVSPLSPLGPGPNTGLGINGLK
ncbi:hypothetical protein QBC37DRAFT_5773 [Rhypophila decipiens]|uniref:Uncharacterized protein n=1 Tax=Rhypophila decipiens TaxID=261697 RepID=A0AAN7BDZ2_9PEZI|nr:hypothetical protein QBC37DRAFT_5773 [Rhypophila decipiens]